MAVGGGGVVLQSQEASCLQVLQVDGEVHIHGICDDVGEVLGLRHLLAVGGCCCPRVVLEVPGDGSSFPGQRGGVGLLVADEGCWDVEPRNLLGGADDAWFAWVNGSYGEECSFPTLNAADVIELAVLVARELKRHAQRSQLSGGHGFVDNHGGRCSIEQLQVAGDEQVVAFLGSLDAEAQCQLAAVGVQVTLHDGAVVALRKGIHGHVIRNGG